MPESPVVRATRIFGGDDNRTIGAGPAASDRSGASTGIRREKDYVTAQEDSPQRSPRGRSPAAVREDACSPILEAMRRPYGRQRSYGLTKVPVTQYLWIKSA